LNYLIYGWYKRMTDWNSKVAIVTGGAQGIGFEIARNLAEAGASVALFDINIDKVMASAKKLKEAGYQALALSGNVSNKEQVIDAVNQVLERLYRIDIMVNNAGICPITELDKITPEEWDLVLAVNLKGTFLFSQAVAPVMYKQKSGKIINIASSAGQMGGLAVGMHYTASKAAILGLTKSLARSLAPYVQVNAVSPGTTNTELISNWDEDTINRIVNQIPARRLGRPADIASAVRFLASDEADFITGQTLNVNGGLLMI